jgi:hypothetical protein
MPGKQAVARHFAGSDDSGDDDAVRDSGRRGILRAPATEVAAPKT